MKPDLGRFERLLRRILKGQEVSPEDLLLHWEAPEADTSVIRHLNRKRAWDEFGRWAERNPQVGQKFLTAKQTAKRALELADLVRQDRKTWQEVRSEMLDNPRIFAAVLDLMEAASSEAGSSFITTVLEESLNRPQDQAVRKAIYRLRQKGVISEPQSTEQRQSPRELFLFGENRLARWQPLLYFRTHSSYTENGDLFVLQLEEGRNFSPSEQRKDIELTAHGMEEIGQRYSEGLERQSGMRINFRPASASHARFFLNQSAELLIRTDGERGIADFLKFIGPGEIQDPLRDFSETRGYMPDPQQSSLVLQTPYFTHWVFTTEELAGFLDELQKLESGPIVLPPAKLLEMRHAAANHWMENYFTSKNRKIWALAFEKAGFFLRDSDFYNAQSAWQIAQTLRDEETPVDRIPAIVFMLERTVTLIMQEKKKQEEKEKETSLIMSPADFAAQQKKLQGH